MRNKKRYIWFFLITLGVVVVLIFSVPKFVQNKNNEILTEYTPEEEISDEQIRQTLVSLYFSEKETKDLIPEARLIDAKMLAENPYKVAIEMLLDGPKNDKLEKVIPEGTKLNSAKLEKGILMIDLSNNFIKDIKLGKEEETKIINSLVYTLVQFNEVQKLKILIDGKENLSFEDKAVDFKTLFQLD